MKQKVLEEKYNGLVLEMDLKTQITLQDAYKEYDIGMVQKMFPKYEDYPPPEPQV